MTPLMLIREERVVVVVADVKSGKLDPELLLAASFSKTDFSSWAI